MKLYDKTDLVFNPLNVTKYFKVKINNNNMIKITALLEEKLRNIFREKVTIINNMSKKKVTKEMFV